MFQNQQTLCNGSCQRFYIPKKSTPYNAIILDYQEPRAKAETDDIFNIQSP